MSDDYDPPLVHLPGTKLTPEVVLHRTLNKKARIKGVALVIQWDDDSFETDWSAMSIADFNMAARTLDRTAMQVMFGEAGGVRYQAPAPENDPA